MASLTIRITPLALIQLLKMYVALGIYPESFEKPFLEHTYEFYAVEGANIPDYLKYVERTITKENVICSIYLEQSTRRPLVDAAARQLLMPHLSAILDKDFVMLMLRNCTEDLQRMFLLLSKINNLESLRLLLKEYIKKAGHDIVMHEKDKYMVFRLLELKKANVDRIWEERFNRNNRFGTTIIAEFSHLINIRQNRPAELIVKFVDEKLRARTSEEELNSTLDKVLVFIGLIEKKDLFVALYKKDLATRLLLGKGVSIDAEESMISKLTTSYGRTATYKLAFMLKDFKLSKAVDESFKQSSRARRKLPSGIEMSVNVMPIERWTFPNMNVKLPRELEVCKGTFERFYSRKYSGRTLRWTNSLSHCVLKAEFPKGERELVVSVYQTAVLMLFNDAQKLSFQDIKESTGIEDEELRRTLQSLACGKFPVLQKIPKGRGVEDDHTFFLNDQFAAHPYRITVPMKETVEKNTIEWELKNLSYLVEAAIVRIMKKRKELSHTRLQTLLSEQLKFPIKRDLLKQKIENLIERDYLERDKKNPKLYKYLP